MNWPIAILIGMLSAITLREALFPFDPDAWWHMRTGDVILSDRGLPGVDPFSWTAGQERWRQNSWLFDVGVAQIRGIGGRSLVSVLMILAALAFGVSCYLLARRAGAQQWPAVGAAAAAEWIMAPHIAERPQMLSYLLFAATVPLADSALRGSNYAFAFLILLVTVWANLHLSFTAGVLLVALVAFASAVQTRRLGRPVLVFAGVAAAGLLNPLHVGAYTAGLDVSSDSWLIQEWRHIGITDPHDLGVIALVCLTMGSLWRTGRWRRLECVLPILVFSAMTFYAIRNQPYLAILIAPELALGASSLRIPTIRAWARERSHILVHGVAVGCALVVGFAVLNVPHLRDAPSSYYPVLSTNAIPKGCRLLNEYRDGGYIIDHRWPEVLVSMDGRNDLYGVDAVRTQQSVLEAVPGSIRWLDDHDVDCVLAHRGRRIIPKLRENGWNVAAEDPGAILLVRPGTLRNAN